MRGLYAIVDLDALEQRGLPFRGFASRVLAAHPACLQVRAKRVSPRATLEVLRAAREECSSRGVPLYANDRPDLAVLAGCDGVHVGQDDLEIDDVRRFAPDLRVGVSTHDQRQVERALEKRPDYIAFGPVFMTRSKDQPDPVVGIERLRAMSELCGAAGCPLVAIGGVTLERARRVASAADAAAVIGALLPPQDEGLDAAEQSARELHAALRGDS